MSKRSFKQVITEASRMLTNDIRDAKWAVAGVIAYFVLFRKFFHSICPMVALTGFPCPGCGLTRAGVAVLRLDFAGAWKFHPFIYPIMVLIVLYFINRYFLLHRRGKELRIAATVVLAAMIIFYIWRMYRYFPGEPPMSYYQYNVVQRALRVLR